MYAGAIIYFQVRTMRTALIVGAIFVIVTANSSWLAKKIFRNIPIQFTKRRFLLQIIFINCAKISHEIYKIKIQ